jgi:hypothetical protein
MADVIEKLARLSGSSWTVGIGLSATIALILLVMVVEHRGGEYDLNALTRPVAAVLGVVTFPVAMVAAVAAVGVSGVYDDVNVVFVVGFLVWMVLALPYGIALDYTLRASHRRSPTLLPAAIAGALAGFVYASMLPTGVYPGTGTGISSSGLVGGLFLVIGAGGTAVVALVGLVMSIRRDTRHRGLPILAAAGAALVTMLISFSA